MWKYIRAGLIDESSIHLVPVLFGAGTRLFDHLGGKHIQLETAGVIETPAATHLRFRIVECRRRVRLGRTGLIGKEWQT